MGSTAEGADIPKETLATDSAGLPSSAMGAGLPEGTVPYGPIGGTPKLTDQGDKESPADIAATSPAQTPEKEEPDLEETAERAAKRARMDEGKSSEFRSVIKNLKKLVNSLEKASGSLDETNGQMRQNNTDIENLSKQMGLDQANSRFMLSTLQTYTNKMESLEWQVSGGRRLASPTLKEQCSNVIEQLKKVARGQEESKKESRAQSDLQVAHLKAIERAMLAMSNAFGNIAVVTANPGVAATAVPPAATPAATPTAAAPTAATPPVATATTAAAAMPAAAATAAVPTAPSMMPGYASSAPAGMGTPVTPAVGMPAAPTFPPMPAFPHTSTAGGGVAYTQAGRLRVRNRDGTEMARAVSPNPRRAEQVSREWLEEFGMGTITHQGLLYRVIPDRYLGDSFALN